MDRGCPYAVYAALAGALSLAVVTGCSTSAPTPSPSTSVSAPSGSSTSTAPASSSVPTSTATSTYPPDVPAEARANTEAGAKAFVGHFLGQVNRAYTTPQQGLIAPLSTAACKSCAGFEEFAARYVKNEQRYDRDAIVVLEVSISPEKPSTGSLLVDAVVRQQEAHLLDKWGKTVESFPKTTVVAAIFLAWADGAWRVAEVQIRA